MSIKKIVAKEVLDSRGNPTVEAKVITSKGSFRAIVPSGASTGIHEAKELRDNNPKRYNGKGVLKAVNNVNKIIQPKLLKQNPSHQKEIDNLMIHLDNTEDKSKLGANAILAVSMAVCRAGAAELNIPLYKHIQHLSKTKKPRLPTPQLNIINGGRHAGLENDIQEHMIIPVNTNSFKESLKVSTEVFKKLKSIIKDKFGTRATALADEGGFVPPIDKLEQRLKLINLAIKKSKHKNQIKLALDVAASEFYNKKNKTYKIKDKTYTPDKLIKLYTNLINKYNITSIEDPFAQDDWESWINFTKTITKQSKNKISIVGDDLLTTNPHRIGRAIGLKACNTLLLKPNQIGTITESIHSANLAKSADWKVIVSHRSGETEDNFIADLAVGIAADQIKAGAPSRGERTCKYNQLLRIESELKK